MYELFFNFLIEELLVRYFKKINVEPGDKFYSNRRLCAPS